MNLRASLLIWVVILHIGLLVLVYLMMPNNPVVIFSLEALLIVSLFSIILIYRRIMKPLKQISEGLLRLKEQDFTVRLEETGDRLTDQMVKVFNGMMQHIRTERAHIRSQHHFLDLLIDASPLGIVILGFDEDITRANPAAIRILGLSGDDIEGKQLKELGGDLCLALSAIREERDMILRLNGYQRYHIRRAGFYDRGFNHPFLIIEELTQEMVRTERESYTRVIRMMSHEVNNTVGAINSILQSMLLFLESEDNKSEAYLQALKVAIKRNEGLDQFMSNFAHVVKLPQPSVVKFDLIQLLQSVILLNKARASEKKVLLKLSFDCNEPVWVLGDYSMLEQALINMVKNAIEASFQCGEVRIEWLNSERCLVVSNNGVELSEEVKERLFSPFFSTKPNGQGIGLILIREILSKHQFKFSFTSNYGRSEFKVWL